jgi:hypothetical protein
MSVNAVRLGVTRDDVSVGIMLRECSMEEPKDRLPTAVEEATRFRVDRDPIRHSVTEDGFVGIAGTLSRLWVRTLASTLPGSVFQRS